MEFDPKSSGLKCQYCGSAQAVNRSVNEKVEEIPYRDQQPSGQLSASALEVACSTCGSTIQCEPSEMSGTCPFCAAKFVNQPKTADPMIAPNGLLPFALPKEQASASVKQWLAGLWFAPGDLKKVARPEGINGVYVPFWTFDAEAASSYSGQRGDYYYETETYTTTDSQGRQVQQTREVRKTRWSYASGDVANSFDDVLIPATRAINPGRLSKLDPWDLEKVCPYEPGYLPGFKAQRYQVELPAGLEMAKGIMNHTIDYSVRQDIGGDEQQVSSIQTEWSGLTFKHLLLPVWIGAYRFQGKVFQVVVNARTGEVQGERPWSVAKLALLVAAIILIVVLIAKAAN